MAKHILVSIGGGHATGVHDTVFEIMSKIEAIRSCVAVEIIDLDDEAKESNGHKRTYSYKDYDFDSIYETLVSKLAEGGCGKQDSTTVAVSKLHIIIICGCYALYDKRINKLSHLKIFIDSDGDKRLINLIRQRKVRSNVELTETLNEYMDHLRIEMSKYIAPTRIYSDIVIPSNNETLGRAIIVDGIVRIVDKTTLDGRDTTSEDNVAVPLWDFASERMEVERSRYYDLT